MRQNMMWREQAFRVKYFSASDGATQSSAVWPSVRCVGVAARTCSRVSSRAEAPPMDDREAHTQLEAAAAATLVQRLMRCQYNTRDQSNTSSIT